MNGIAVIVGIVFYLANSCLSYNDLNTTPRSKTKLIARINQYHHPRFPSLNNAQISKRQIDSSNDCDSDVNHNKNHRDDIFYPDAMPLISKKKKKQCVYNLCWDVDDYPKEQIKNVTIKSAFLEAYFNETMFPQEAVSFDTRFGTDEETLCSVTRKTVFPEKARNKNNEEKIIINVEGKRQAIVYELCGENQNCKFSESFPNEYTSYCKQIFVSKRLVVYSEKEPYAFDTFDVPSCCVCTLKKTSKKN